MSVKPERVQEILKEIAESEGFTSFDHTFSAGSNKGDNYVGEILRVVVTGEKANGRIEELDLILKIAPLSAKWREHFNCNALFKQEDYFYNVLAPALEKFQRDQGLTAEQCFKAYPKCYYSICDAKTEEFLLVFENLRTTGFEMFQKGELHPLQTISSIIKELAKFHAVSFAMRDKKPKLFDKLRRIKNEYPTFMELEGSKEIIESSMARAIDLLENPDHVNVYKHILNNCQKYFDDFYNEERLGRFGSIVHCDTWNNNIMLQYSKVKYIFFIFIRNTKYNIRFLFFFFFATDKRSGKYKIFGLAIPLIRLRMLRSNFVYFHSDD